MSEVAAPAIPGADELVRWFGSWPSFHDAEVLEVRLDRRSKSSVRIHTWRMTSEVDAQGYFVLDHHVVVTFWLEGLTALSLDGFSAQNVIAGLDVEATPSGHLLRLAPCYGLAGEVEAAKISISIEPGKP